MDDQEKEVEFVASAGMMMVMVNGKEDPEKREMLEFLLSDFTSQPDKLLHFDNAESLKKKGNINLCLSCQIR